MQQKFELHLQQNHPYLLTEKFLIAISGGIDSVVLAHLCYQADLNFALAHCNFQLRGKESDEDENFIRRLGKELKTEVFVQKFDTARFVKKDASIQLIAREQRYQWFDQLLKKTDYSYILTAHHLDDDIETFFINLLRGSGLKGLTGIPPENKKIIRPLLKFSKQELIKFAQENLIKWREDQTNFSDDYLRNRIRNHIIPVLEEENPNFKNSFSQTQSFLKDAFLLNEDYRKLLKTEISHQENNFIFFDIEKIQSLPNKEAVIYLLFNAYGFTAWRDIENLLNAESGKMVLSKTHRLLKDKNFLVLDKNNSSEKAEITIQKEEKLINFPAGKLICENVINVSEFDNQIAYLAAEKLEYPLKLRIWKPGDRFQPLGMKGHKNLSDFLKDEKLNLFEKENVWVLLSNETIVWVVGHRIHDAFKIKDGINKILKIKWLK